MATKSLVKVPYSSFKGQTVIVNGYRSRGIYKVEIIERAFIEGECDSKYRFMLCKILETYRDPHKLEINSHALIPIEHSIKEIVKKIYRIGNHGNRI